MREGDWKEEEVSRNGVLKYLTVEGVWVNGQRFCGRRVRVLEGQKGVARRKIVSKMRAWGEHAVC